MFGKSLGFGGAAAACLLFAHISLGQTASFTGTGRLAPDRLVKATGVSAGGSVVVGDAVDANGKTQAFIWTAAGGLHGIGFLDATYQETHATDVGKTASGLVKVCGYGKDATNKDRAFLWTGDETGTGTFQLIPLLGGTSNAAYGLYITGEDVRVTGDSDSPSAGTGKKEGFYWQEGEPDCDGIGYLNGGTPDSHGRAIGLRDSTTHIAGYANSKWSGGYNSREAASWKPQTQDPLDPGGLGGDAGLTKVCGGEPWQIWAGPNGIAETTASATDLQITPVNTDTHDPNAVVISAGADNVLVTNPAGDDVFAPSSSSASGNESLYRSMSPNGRYKVGRSNYIVGSSALFEANLRDVKNRDYDSPDNCGGQTFHWPLGFCKLSNTGQPVADNYSEAWGVSNGASSTGSRNGLVVVGTSFNTTEIPRASRAFICMIQDGPDMWFLRQAGADPSDYGAGVGSRFKDMRNLQWLLSHDWRLDLTGWDLNEALAVSDDGKTVCGWGLHNGVAEGFVATVPSLPELGACCNHSTLECSIQFPADCQGEYLGANTVCTTCCPKPFSDGDTDGDVDMDDFALFQACLTTASGSTIQPGCECWDQDKNGAIDDVDYERAFTICGTGPSITADPNCQ